jgi:hypothetical protein
MGVLTVLHLLVDFHTHVTLRKPPLKIVIYSSSHLRMSIYVDKLTEACVIR